VGPDRASFASFYEQSRDDCLRTVLAAVGDLPTAEDLVAEAFARAWASWRKVSRHPTPRAWVVRTALNANVSRWRKGRRELAVGDSRAVPGERMDEPVADDPIDPALLIALRRLPERQRQVIALRVFLDLDVARTAELLGLAPGTVTAHLARAMATLRAEVTPAQANEGSP
jgi:RNA polymerase sigma-70 factor (sigma-E family)